MASRKYKTRDELKGEIYRMFHHAQLCSWTHAELLKRSTEFWDQPSYARLPAYQKSYLRGVMDVMRDELYRDWLVFAHVVAGRYVPCDYDHAGNRPEFDYPTITAQNTSEDESLHSRHVWRHSLKPF